MKKILLSFAVLAMIFSVQDVKSQDLDEILGEVANAGVKATYEKEYKFDTYIQLEVSDLGDQTMVYNGYLTKDGSATAILFTADGENSVVLIDSKNKALLMLSDTGDEKTGFAMSFDPEALSDLTEELKDEMEQDSYAEFKTGKTKELLGYTCDEYLIKEEGSEVRMWASAKLGKEIAEDIIANQQVFGGAFAHAAGMNGMVLEYEYVNESNGDNRTMKVTELDLDTNFTVSTSDYSVMSMGQ